MTHSGVVCLDLARGLGLLSRNGRKKPIELTTEMERLRRSRDWLILTKANSISTVHRSAFLDYVGVKLYDKKGNTIGERFLASRFIQVPKSIRLEINNVGSDDFFLVSHDNEPIDIAVQQNIAASNGNSLLVPNLEVQRRIREGRTPQAGQTQLIGRTTEN